MYGLDLLDAGSPRLSWPRVIRLVSRLPLSSNWAAVQYGGMRPWGPTEFLLAGVIQALSGSKVESPQERRRKQAKLASTRARLEALEVTDGN